MTDTGSYTSGGRALGDARSGVIEEGVQLVQRRRAVFTGHLFIPPLPSTVLRGFIENADQLFEWWKSGDSAPSEDDGCQLGLW